MSMSKRSAVFAVAMAMAFMVGCAVQPTVTQPTSGLSSSQQVIASAALAEAAAGSALKTAHDTANTLYQGGVVSATDHASVLAWIASAARQNDNAIALTKAAANTGNDSGIAAAVVAVAAAIGQQPSFADVKSPAAQQQVEALVGALLQIASNIQQEFGK